MGDVVSFSLADSSVELDEVWQEAVPKIHIYHSLPSIPLLSLRYVQIPMFLRRQKTINQLRNIQENQKVGNVALPLPFRWHSLTISVCSRTCDRGQVQAMGRFNDFNDRILKLVTFRATHVSRTNH